MTFLKNYKQTLILIAAIIIGAIVGVVWGEGAAVLSPLGDVFINLMFVIIVPLIFLTISTSISKISQPKRVGKILGTIVLVFVITSLVAVLIGLTAAYPIELVSPEDGANVLASLESPDEENAEMFSSLEKIVDSLITAGLVSPEDGANILAYLEPPKEETTEELSYLERTVNVLTVNDFSKILTKDNIIAIVVFAIIFGISIRMAGEKGKKTQEFLESLSEVIMKVVTIIMYYAPIGLGCYFASFIGENGAGITIGYIKTFVIYTIACLVCFFVVYTLYAFIAGGKEGVKRFWKNVIPATVTALATCSSAASIPVNMQTAKNIGVSDEIAETMIPLGTSFHKDGSIIGSVFKAMFLVCLFGGAAHSIVEILFISLLATLLVTAIPIGGGTISETMIIQMLGYPLSTLPILTVIATIIDAPATVLNVVGDSASSMLAARIVDGKDWMYKKEVHTEGEKVKQHA